MLKQQWTIEEISIFSNSSHLEWRVGLSDTIFKGTIPARFSVIWFSGFRGEDLNVIFYQNIPKMHNRYKSAERNISPKNSDSPALHSRWLLLLKIEISSFVHCSFSINQNELKF
jgi:hypothetical protein